MAPLCYVPDSLISPTWIWIGGEIFVVILIILLGVFLWRTTRGDKAIGKWFTRFLILPGGLVIFVVGSVIVSIIFILIFGDDNPPSAKYHNLNAAVKNTCFLDPMRSHCPQTAQDLINIQPQQFVDEVKDAHLTYQYYPETNDYTLIIRNNDYVMQNNNRVVVFDSRLPKVKNYGSGLDFVDTEVVKCGNTYSLTTPPPFPGPWNKIN